MPRPTPRTRCRRKSGRSCRRGRRAASAQPCYRQGVIRTRCVGSDVADHYHQGFPSGNLNLEGLIRIWAEARVSNPVGADVIGIEAPQISGDEDEAKGHARRIRVDCHALRCASGAWERVRIVTVQQPVTKNRARRSRRTGLRNPAAVEFISLRWIGVIDASLNHDGNAVRGTSRRRR